ncbi:RNA polymerase sigma factor [Lysinibacillus sphaericus]|uniref:RNA polymerase sigma factor n=1 Tax=Lysinibacillus sphaericus TaxID=1421 RepID=UPI003D03B6AA
MARNLVYDHFRRKKILRFIPFVHNECIRDETVLPEEFLIKGEDFSALFLALYKIKLEYREAIILRYLEELSVKDTAKLLGWSEAKVKNNTARGLQTLRKHLGEEGLLMNEKLNHLLQEMQEVKRNDAEKEETWRKLQGRLQKKTRSNHWQYRTVFTVVLAMLVLIMTMLITESNYSNKNATLPLSNAIRTVHFYETDTPNQFNGKDSRLYFGVEKLTSTAYQQLEKLLALQQNTQLPANVVKDLDSEAYDLVITFQDGHQQRLKWYHYAATDGELLMLDWDTKVFHMIPEATALEVREEIWQLQKDFSHISIKGPIILIVAVLLNALLTRLILKKYKLPKKPELFPQKKMGGCGYNLGDPLVHIGDATFIQICSTVIYWMHHARCNHDMLLAVLD